jgi:hypothetical protein
MRGSARILDACRELALARVVALVVFGLLAACTGNDREGTRALHELERMTFVPDSGGRLQGFVEPLADCSLDRAIVIDLFEFSRRDGLHYDFARRDLVRRDLGGSEVEPGSGEEVDAQAYEWITDAAKGGPERLDWPLYLDHFEAEELARRRGMRLPTPREWIHVATGGRSYGYPYHASTRQRGVANTAELELGTPSPVGVFERGRSRPFGCYDMVGNVWEWVDGVVPGYTDVFFDSPASIREGGGPEFASIMGGSYLDRTRRTFGHREGAGGPELRFNAMRQSRGYLSPRVGARMCADAETYLQEKASEWGSGSRDEARIHAVGRRWAVTSGREVVTLFLDELAERPGAPEQLQWLAAGGHENP